MKQSESGPVIVMRNGKAVAVLLAITDNDELERLILAHSPKFRAILEKLRRQIEKTGGIPHDQFWREVEAESRHDSAEAEGKPASPESRVENREHAKRRHGGIVALPARPSHLPSEYDSETVWHFETEAQPNRGVWCQKSPPL